jgi:hypothetical protein
MDKDYIFANTIETERIFPKPLLKYLKGKSFILENYTINK